MGGARTLDGALRANTIGCKGSAEVRQSLAWPAFFRQCCHGGLIGDVGGHKPRARASACEGTSAVGVDALSATLGHDPGVPSASVEPRGSLCTSPSASCPSGLFTSARTTSAA